jgi:hypothetical protein
MHRAAEYVASSNPRQIVERQQQLVIAGEALPAGRQGSSLKPRIRLEKRDCLSTGRQASAENASHYTRNDTERSFFNTLLKDDLS